MRECTCVSQCHKAAGSRLGDNWYCRVEAERAQVPPSSLRAQREPFRECYGYGRCWIALQRETPPKGEPRDTERAAYDALQAAVRAVREPTATNVAAFHRLRDTYMRSLWQRHGVDMVDIPAPAPPHRSVHARQPGSGAG